MEKDILDEVYAIICDRRDNPKAGSYVNSLLSDPKGSDRTLEKIGEEATEVIIAAKNGGEREIVSESADLLFHLMIMLAAKGVPFDKVREELERRRK